MGRRKLTAEEIIGKLRQAEVAPAQGIAVPDVRRRLGVTEQPHYRTSQIDRAGGDRPARS